MAKKNNLVEKLTENAPKKLKMEEAIGKIIDDILAKARVVL